MAAAQPQAIPRLGNSEKYSYNKYERALLFYQSNPVEACRDIILKNPIWFQRLTLRALWDTQYCLLKWSRGSSKCQPGNELLYLPDKGTYVPIQDLCGQNIKVLAMDENYRLITTNASVENNDLAECLKVKLRSGRSIEVTKEHPFYTINGWTEAKDLNIKDRVAAARRMPHVTRSSVGKSKARLLGYFLGDGSIIAGANFTNADDIILNNFKSCVNNAFGDYDFRCVRKSKATTIYVTNNGRNEILVWLRELDLWGKNSHNKFVPNCVYSWSLEDISNFIGAYFDCDGTARKENNSISISSVSEELLKGIQRLLLKFEILSSIRKENTTWVYKGIRKRSIAYNLDVYGSDNVNRFIGSIESISNKFNRLQINNVKTNPNNDTIPKEIWDIYIAQYGIQLKSRQHTRIYNKQYSPSREKLKKFGKEFKVYDATKLSESDIFWDEIESIEKTGLQQTYSVEVPKYHNYLADTTITHNSSCVSMYLVLKAILYPGCRMGVIAPSFRQTSYVFDEIEDMYHESPFVRQSALTVPKRGTDRNIIKFHNKSFIEGLPIGADGKKIRGRRYNFLFLDEFAQMDEETVRLVIRPMLAVMKHGRRNQLIMASSPFYKFNHFWERYSYYKKMMKEDPDRYYCSSHNLVDVVIANFKDYQMDLDMVMQAYDSDPEDSFLMEWMGIFPDETSGFFPNQLIDSCVPRGIRELVPIEINGDETAVYTMGVDPARSEQGDQFSISLLKIGKNNTKELVKIIAARGMTFPNMADLIRQQIFVHNFNVVDLRMDSRGGGTELKDLLAQPSMCRGTICPAIVSKDDILSGAADPEHSRGILNMVDFNIRSINEMYFKFKSDMEQQRILFPMDIRRHEDTEIEKIGNDIAGFKNEMRVMQTSITAHGLKFDVPSKFTKDRLTSTVLANFGAAEYLNNDINAEQMTENLLSMGQWIKV